MTRILPLIPGHGHDALMTGVLTIGTAVDALCGSAIHIALLRDLDTDPAF